MKKNIITIMMAFAALLMTQCKKQAEQQTNEPAGPTMEVTVSVKNGADKTEITATGAVTWKKGDILWVVSESQGLLGFVSAVKTGDPVRFDGKITALSSAEKLRFYYVGNQGFALDGGGNYTFDLSNQDGTLEGIAKNCQLMFGITTENVAVGATDFGTITMTSLMSIAHLNINSGGAAVSGPVTVSGGLASSTFNAKAYDGTELTGTSGNMTLTFNAPTVSTNCYLALLPGTQTLKFSNGLAQATLDENLVEANKFYNSGTAINVAVTAASKFTVADPDGIPDNGDEVTVEFAPGNLWYGIADGESTPAFHFEDNQWDYSIGDLCPEEEWGENVYNWVPNHVSHFYWSSTKDWQESGQEPYAEVYSFSTWTLSDVFFTEASDFQVEGEDVGAWRTLSRAEWNYLLGYDPELWAQTETYGRPGAKNLCAWKGLDGGTHNGLVILPDGTKNPSEVLGSITSTSDLATYNAVFLPAGGSRGGAIVESIESWGDYWSSTPGEAAYRGYLLVFFSEGVRSVDGCYRSIACHVRLVHDVNISGNGSANDFDDAPW